MSTKGWDILHQGAKTDIIGDYDFRNRVFSPTLGRWLTNDPIGFSAGDVNTFRYVGNGPGNKKDPLGLWQEQKYGAGAVSNQNLKPEPNNNEPQMPWPPFQGYPVNPREGNPGYVLPPNSSRGLPPDINVGNGKNRPIYGSTEIRNKEIIQSGNIVIDGPGVFKFIGNGGVTLPIFGNPGSPKGNGKATIISPGGSKVEGAIEVQRGEFPNYGITYYPRPIEGVGNWHPLTPLQPSFSIIIHPQPRNADIFPFPSDFLNGLLFMGSRWDF